MSAMLATARVDVRRTLGARRERVFAAWTRPEMIAQWFGPEMCTVPQADVDSRVGGAFRFHVRLPTKMRYVGGVYVEYDPPRRLAFTWGWEDIEAPESLVTVEFHERDEGARTEVVLTHERLPSRESAEHHERGWLACMDGLGALFG